jgi:hypothetical protein
MKKFQNNFVKTDFGFKNCPKTVKKHMVPKKHTMVHEKCPPQKPGDQAKVTAIDCTSVDFELEGNELNVPVIDTAVALAEIELTANVEADIHLPTPASEIKNIRKNVSLTQCKAVPSLSGPGFVSLFITGFIHKNIQFSDGSGFIRDHHVDVPFSCNQTVELVNPTDFASSLKNTVVERRELAKKGHGADRCTHSQINFEFFNEPIDCKLLAAFINEVDLLKKFNKCGRFNKITEKMEVVLFIKLLQNQQVALADNGNGNGDAAGTTVSSRLQELRDRI